jgi:putative transposase
LACRADLEWRGKPGAIRCDNGPEYVSGELLGWAEREGICIEHIQPGKPQQNAYVERYNRTVRYGWLAKHCSTASNRSSTRPLDGYGLTTTSARTWRSAASRRCKNWHSLRSSTFGVR